MSFKVVLIIIFLSPAYGPHNEELTSMKFENDFYSLQGCRDAVNVFKAQITQQLELEKIKFRFEDGECVPGGTDI